MKKALIGLMVVMLVAVACKKDKGTGGSDSLIGYWEGNWTYTSSSSKPKMAVIFNADGSTRTIYGYTTDTASAYYKVKGSYTLTDGVVRFSYLEGSDTYIHKASVGSGKMSGTWGESPNDSGEGTFELTKK